MYYLEYEPETMAPFLRGLIRRFLASRISSPSLPSNQTASQTACQTPAYAYLQAQDGTPTPKLQERRGSESSEKFNLESIPGLWFWILVIFSETGNSLSELLLFILGYRILFLPGIQSFQLSYAMPTTSSIFSELDSILISIDSTFFYWMAREVVLDVQVVCNLFFSIKRY